MLNCMRTHLFTGTGNVNTISHLYSSKVITEKGILVNILSTCCPQKELLTGIFGHSCVVSQVNDKQFIDINFLTKKNYIS